MKKWPEALEVHVHVVVTHFKPHVLEEVLTVHHRTLGVVLQDGLGGVVHGSRAFGTALRGHEDDTVTGLGAVDGGGGGILQDLDGLDHRRLDVLDAGDLQAVHDVQRGEVATIGGVTTDADVSAAARSTVREDVHTGGLALEGVGRIDGGQVLEGLLTDRSHGAGEVALLLHTVTDDHRLVQEFGVLREDEAESGLVPAGDRLVGVADAGDVDGSARRDIETESSVHVSHCADGRVADHDDSRPDHRSAALVDNRSADGAVLGGRNRSQEARCDDHHSGGHSCKKLPGHKSVVLVG